MRLSPTMIRALDKLTPEYRSAYALDESRGTLDALERRGLAERVCTPGAAFFPRVHTKYRMKL